MLPVRYLRLKLGELLADDLDTWLDITGLPSVILVSEDFVPSDALLIGDLTAATFTGSTPLTGSATQEAGIDPATGEQVVSLITPLGGWRWECTAAPASPQTIYGYGVRQGTSNILLATGKLLVPITITDVGDFIDLGTLDLRILLQPMS